MKAFLLLCGLSVLWMATGSLILTSAIGGWILFVCIVIEDQAIKTRATLRDILRELRSQGGKR